MTNDIKLTIIVGGRNDGYGDNKCPNSINYIDRFKYSMESMHRSLKNINYEIIMMDINSSKDMAPLSDVFKHKRIRHVSFSNDEFVDSVDRHFSYGAKFISGKKECSFDEIVSLSYNYIIPFNKFLKEARGEYVLSTATDNIFSIGFEEIINRLSHNIIYRCKRNNIDHSNFSPLDFEKVMNRKYDNFIDPNAGGKNRIYGGKNTLVKAPGDFTLMDRKSWLQVGGFLPIPSNRLFAIDSYLVFSALALGKRIYAIDEKEYHLGNLHVPPRKNKSIKFNHFKMNYQVKHKKVRFDYKKEIKSKTGHRGYIGWTKNIPYDGKLLYKEFGYKKRYDQIRELLDEI